MGMQFPRLLRPLLSSSLLWRVSSSSKVIYLTFDDGPVPGVTPQVLEILDRYGWKATFFCVGDNVRKYPELFDEVKKRGHVVANHTFNHIKGFWKNSREYYDNVMKAAELIDSDLFRPPHGQITGPQIRKLKKHFRLVMWDVITYDYDKSLTPDQVLNKVKRNCRKGSIVVFHDSLKAEKNMLEVLPQAIEFWISEGYTWNTL